MQIQFEYMKKQCTFDTVQRMIHGQGVTVPFVNASEALRAAALKAKVDFQRKQNQQFDPIALLG